MQRSRAAHGGVRGVKGTTILFIVFLVLKLGVGDTSVQHWSWWWVTLPLWGPVALILVALSSIGFAVLVWWRLKTAAMKRARDRWLD